MHITKVHLKRFKQFNDNEVKLHEGLTIVAGANNAGKSSLLQALAVWEFCKVAIVAEKGPASILSSSTTAQGLGIGDDEFSPINIPSLNHLWTNLRSSKVPGKDPDGYTLSIRVEWQDTQSKEHLEFSLSLANDRLFVKASSSSLSDGQKTPTVAYLPPFAGITAREERITGALRRRRIGQGLTGAVLRNLLLDMKLENVQERDILQGAASRIPEKDLTRLREEDPWELLQGTLRELFSAELVIGDFNEQYHSYIKADVVKGNVNKYKLTRYPNFKARDVMVEGSGFLQWLSVYTLATSPEADVLLFDEPDAHLHAALQTQLVERLSQLAEKFGKQVLLATHSTEIIRSTTAGEVLEVRSGSPRFRYLQDDEQKVGLIVGIGGDYSPRIEKVRELKKVLFFEGTTDKSVLTQLALALGKKWPTGVVPWQTPDHVKERKILWRALRAEFGDIRALSIRDRDDEAANTVGADLEDRANPSESSFQALKWRRRYIESYLIWPEAIAAASGRSVSDVNDELAREFGLATIGPDWTKTDAADTFRDLRGKDILRHFGVNAIQVAREIPAAAICDDIKMFLSHLESLAAA
jgi:predicted ATPase